MINNFPFELYSDEVGDNESSVQCNLWNKWNHTRCLNIGVEQYENYKKDPLPWYCPNWAMEILSQHDLIKAWKVSFLESLLKL